MESNVHGLIMKCQFLRKTFCCPNLFIKKVRPARGHIYIDYDGKLKTLTPVRRFAHFPNSVNALSALESTEYMMKINDNWDKITNICEIL